MANNSAVKEKPRISAERDCVVEFLRTIGCASVVIYHVVWAFAPVSAYGERSNLLLPMRCAGDAHLMNWLPFDFMIAGNCALGVFFILSGYVLSMPIFRRSTLNWPSLSGDILKRYFRLAVPLYAFCFLAYLCFKFGLYEKYGCAAAQLTGSNGFLVCSKLAKSADLTFLWALVSPFEYSSNLVPPAWTIGVELVGSFLTYLLAGIIHSSSAAILIATVTICLAPGYLKLFAIGTLIAYLEYNGKLNYAAIRAKLGNNAGFFAAVCATICLYFDAFPWYANAEQIAQFAPYFAPLTVLNTWLLQCQIAGGITSLSALLTFLCAKLWLPQNGLVEFISRAGKHTYTVYLSHMIFLSTICSFVFIKVASPDLSHFGTAIGAASATLLVCSILMCVLMTDLIDGNAIKLARKIKTWYLNSLEGSQQKSAKLEQLHQKAAEPAKSSKN